MADNLYSLYVVGIWHTPENRYLYVHEWDAETGDYESGALEDADTWTLPNATAIAKAINDRVNAANNPQANGTMEARVIGRYPIEVQLH